MAVAGATERAVNAPVFYYDFNSPYGYLAAMRIDDVFPVKAQWRPISFGVIVRRTGKVPWSFAPDRQEHFDDIDRRARERGLPQLRYPEGWPVQCYSLLPLRAALLAADQDQLRAASRELYHTMFAEGRGLDDVEAVLDAVSRAGMDRDAVQAGIGRDEIKERLRELTDEALDRGVTGVPTVAIDGELFWGDDRLEDAAAQALPGARAPRSARRPSP